MAKRIEVNPDWPWAEKFGFHLGIRVENTVYVSGTVAWDRDGNIVGQDNMLEQSRQAFLNVKEILAEAGATMDDVVKINAFLTDINRYAEYSAARAEAFTNNIPASTAVASPALVEPGLLIEIEAIAEIGSG